MEKINCKHDWNNYGKCTLCGKWNYDKNHDPRTCQNSVPCHDCECVESDDLANCPHEDNITYGALETVDGEPQYSVTCETCGRKGVIHLVEDTEDWEE